jgi:predicted TIM-barrel fold metal-dependent hydrolase
MITDTQIHLWGPNRPERPWLHGGPPVTHLQRAVYAPEILEIMADCAVDRAVLVPPPWEQDANEIAFAAAAAHPGKFAVMGLFDPTAPLARERLELWLEQPHALGIRMIFVDPPAVEWLNDGTIEWFWAALERLRIPLMIYSPRSCDKLHRIAERYPGLTLILDHLGFQQRKRNADAFVHFEDALALARHPNVFAKVSSLPAYVTEGYPFPTLTDPIRRAYDAFGPSRLMWGSDYTKLPCAYGECVDHFRIALEFLTTEDKEWIMGRTAATALGWPEQKGSGARPTFSTT